MAIQNAAHRIHMPTAPPTTLMTGSTTQVMIDLADLLRGPASDARKALVDRLGRLSSAVAAFAVGCAAGALLFASVGVCAFTPLPVLGAISLFL